MLPRRGSEAPGVLPPSSGLSPCFLLGAPVQGTLLHQNPHRACWFPKGFPKWTVSHLHCTAKHAHQVAHISIHLLPAVATLVGIQKGSKDLPLVLVSWSWLPPSFILNLQEPLEGGGGR